jgi:hypothetical protein
MTYSDKLKAAKTIISAVNRLRDKEYIVVSYGTDYNNEPMRYRITANFYKSGTSYSINKDDVWAMNGMNIAEFTNTMAKAYTFDMMSQRTTYNFPLYKMTIVEEPFKVTDNNLEFNA